MIDKVNILERKRINRKRIYYLLKENKGLSKQDITYNLQLSLPTVTQNLNELQKLKLIEDTGVFGYTGGRNARAYSIVSDAKVSIGLDITKNHITIVAVDLYGEVMGSKRIRYPFSLCDTFFRKLGSLVNEIIESIGVKEEKILGVGIALPALITKDHKTIFYGNILDITGETVDSFSKYISFPCILCNDANAAGFAELWARKDIEHAFYISLSNNIGGSVLINNKLYFGENQRSGEIGHITIVPGGKNCYCGQKGCVETYCAATILSDSTEGNLGEFFNLLKEGKEEQVTAWKEYLYYLSIAVNNLRMLFDCDVILGGYVGAYMDDYMDDLKKLALARNTFEDNADYLRVCKYKKEAIAAGAALPYIEEFLNNI